MRTRLPQLLCSTGSLLVVAALVYATLTGAGIPYQDPTPEMRARELGQNRVVDSLLIAGVLLIAAGIVALIYRRLRGKS